MCARYFHARVPRGPLGCWTQPDGARLRTGVILARPPDGRQALRHERLTVIPAT